MAFSPSWLPIPLPGCLLLCCESLFPCPLPCCAFSEFLASWPSSPSCASPCCCPFCCLSSLLFCFVPCCALLCAFWSLPCCACPCWFCCGLAFESRFWNASFILLISELSLESLESCLPPSFF